MLRDRVEDFIAHRADLAELSMLLDECAQAADLEALLCVRRLFEDMYGGITFNLELKAPAAYELACWGAQGLDQLAEATLSNPTSKNVMLCVQILSEIAARLPTNQLSPFNDRARMARIENALSTDPSLSNFARSKLVELVLSIGDENDLVELIGTGFSTLSWHSPAVAKELFIAVSTRWLAVSKPLLERFERLISERPSDEPTFQAFFTEYPQILDPMAVDVWPQPNLLGAKKPDFIIRRTDNTYLVIEIETPAKQLVTQSNQLAAPATLAIAQVTDYRRFVERLPNLEIHFPGLDGLSCMAVVGLERGLNVEQRQALRNDNRQRYALQTVGFDWLADRARAIQGNVIRTGIQVHGPRTAEP